MATEDVLRKADFHRNAMTLLAAHPDQVVQQIATASLDSMAWLDANFKDIGDILIRVSELESQLQAANESIRQLQHALRLR